MALEGKDRRGLAEIVTLASVLVVLGSVVLVQLLVTHTASTELIVVLAGVGAALPIRGVQSAMERGASSEQRNFESSELQRAADLFRREADELRRALTDLQRGRLDEANRALLMATTTKKEG